MGMDWKSAMKAIRAFHAPGLDGSPATLQKELDGLEESLKGWEERDERREASFKAWKGVDAKLRADQDQLVSENIYLKGDLKDANDEVARLNLQIEEIGEAWVCFIESGCVPTKEMLDEITGLVLGETKKRIDATVCPATWGTPPSIWCNKVKGHEGKHSDGEGGLW
jgi:hypothetical protein